MKFETVNFQLICDPIQLEILIDLILKNCQRGIKMDVSMAEVRYHLRKGNTDCVFSIFLLSQVKY